MFTVLKRVQGVKPLSDEPGHVKFEAKKKIPLSQPPQTPLSLPLTPTSAASADSASPLTAPSSPFSASCSSSGATRDRFSSLHFRSSVGIERLLHHCGEIMQKSDASEEEDRLLTAYLAVLDVRIKKLQSDELEHNGTDEVHTNVDSRKFAFRFRALTEAVGKKGINLSAATTGSVIRQEEKQEPDAAEIPLINSAVKILMRNNFVSSRTTGWRDSEPRVETIEKENRNDWPPGKKMTSENLERKPGIDRRINSVSETKQKVTSLDSVVPAFRDVPVSLRTETQLSEDKGVQDELLADVADLTSALKANVQRINKSLKQDAALVEATSSLVESNIDKVTAEVKKLKEHSTSSFFNALWTWAMLIAMVAIFIGTYLFMRFAPKFD